MIVDRFQVSSSVQNHGFYAVYPVSNKNFGMAQFLVTRDKGEKRSFLLPGVVYQFLF